MLAVAQAPSGVGGKILVVDDDRLVLATLAHGLTQAGYDVIDADNGDDAILLAREHRPDLALLDIRMEGMSGFDVAAYQRAMLPRARGDRLRSCPPGRFTSHTRRGRPIRPSSFTSLHTAAHRNAPATTEAGGV